MVTTPSAENNLSVGQTIVTPNESRMDKQKEVKIQEPVEEKNKVGDEEVNNSH